MSARSLHLRGRVAFAIALSGVSLAGQTPIPDTSLPAVLRAAAGYVEAYQRQLTQLVAEETYKQNGKYYRVGYSLSSRELKSDVLFMFAPGDHAWLAVRDVRSVDGKAVDDYQDFVKLLKDTSVTGLAKELRDHNARFNLGTTIKLNFNEPTLALQILDASNQPRFEFTERKLDKSDGVVIATLAFTEKQSPTMIALVDQSARKDVFTKGEVSVEVATGRVRHMQVAFEAGSVKTKLTTTYRLDDLLQMWVPQYFDTAYAAGPEEITGEATYTNYRKFHVETSEIIK